jgi:hypothetical protein
VLAADDEDVRQLIGEGDGHEVPVDLPGHAGIEELVDRELPDRGHAQGVAVGRGLRDGVHADIAARPRAVLDDEVLAEPGLELLGIDARHHVGGAGGREGDDHPHRAVGPFRARRAGLGRGGAEKGQGQPCPEKGTARDHEGFLGTFSLRPA